MKSYHGRFTLAFVAPTSTCSAKLLLLGEFIFGSCAPDTVAHRTSQAKVNPRTAQDPSPPFARNAVVWAVWARGNGGAG